MVDLVLAAIIRGIRLQCLKLNFNVRLKKPSQKYCIAISYANVLPFGDCISETMKLDATTSRYSDSLALDIRHV